MRNLATNKVGYAYWDLHRSVGIRQYWLARGLQPHAGCFCRFVAECTAGSAPPELFCRFPDKLVCTLVGNLLKGNRFYLERLGLKYFPGILREGAEYTH